MAIATVMFLPTGNCASKELFSRNTEVRNFTLGKETIPIRRIIPITNDYDQCYVLITVHNSSSFTYGVENATVTVISMRQLADGAYNYTGFSDGTTNNNGQACVLVHCRAEGIVFVEKYSIRISALNVSMQESRLPPYFAFDLRYLNEYIFFYTYPWGPVNGREGPVFFSDDVQKCMNARQNDYHFVFSYLSIPDVLNDTVAPLTTSEPVNDFVWYYGLDGERRTCFMKVKIKTQSSQISIATSSSMDTSSGPQLLGTFYTGPQYDVSKSETIERAACILFRCPAVSYFTGDMGTQISGTVNNSPHEGCCVRPNNTNIYDITPTGFSTKQPLSPHLNYGPSQGIYIAYDHQNARARCFTGHDYLGNEYAMDVNEGIAFEYDCTMNKDCQHPTIVG